MKFSTIDAIVLDMDGVLWRGDMPLPGMQELFMWLHKSAIPFALATNNSGKAPADYIEKLAQMDVHTVTEQNIVTSGTATAAYMQSRFIPGTEVYVVSTGGLQYVLAEAGFDISDDHEQPQVVVAGIDFNLNYEKLRKATLAIRNGAEFIGTNPDKTFPSPDGLVPGAGSVIAAIEAATDVSATIIGKPALPMFRTALEIVGTPPERTLMVGDRINTDIEGGRAAGMQTALVFTGVTTPVQMETAALWPDVAYEGLPDLLKAWAGFAWYNNKMKIKRGRT